ncbi:MADS-box transcription factor 50 [Bienertia sinuspersici]
MVRGKTVMRRIKNDSSGQVTFSKKRNDLLEKAFSDVEVALVVFSPSGKLYEFASSGWGADELYKRCAIEEMLLL